MKLTNSSKSNKHHKLKVALIPLLVLLLLYVLVAPEAASPPPLPASKSNTSSQNNHSSGTAEQENLADPETTMSQAKRVNNWRKMPLSEIVKHNPFRLLPLLEEKARNKVLPLQREPEVVREPVEDQAEKEQLQAANSALQEQEDLKLLKENLRQYNISGILYSSQTKAAIINSKIYHEGDLLKEGIRVGKINPEGVLFQIESATKPVLK